jgi:hypothetical protein
MNKWAKRIALAFVGAVAIPLAILAQTPPPVATTASQGYGTLAYCWDTVALAVVACGSGHTGGTVSSSPGLRTSVPLDIATVTTGGSAVTALAAGHRTAGGWIANPSTATVNLGINEIGTAAGTTGAGNTTFIAPGQTYTLAPSANAVSVISSDSTHPFSGYGWQ